MRFETLLQELGHEVLGRLESVALCLDSRG